MTATLQALIYLDYPGARERRAALRASHLKYIAERAEHLRAAGPLLDAQGQPCGSLLIFESNDVGTIEALAAGDPYVAEKVVETVRILQWNLALWAPPSSLLEYSAP